MPLQFSRLYSSPLIDVTDVRCRPDQCGCSAEEEAVSHQLIFPRRGVFVRHTGKAALIADPAHAHFFNRAQTYRVSHPYPGGDDCTVLAFEPAAIVDVLGAMD